jgi:triphosphatase
LALRRRKLRKKAKSFAELDPPRRHKLRIQAKKLRYASDFFGGLFSGKQSDKRRKKFLAALEAVQDCLGDLNDIAVHENMISAAGMGHRPTSRKRAFAAGLLTGQEDATHRCGDGCGPGSARPLRQSQALLGMSALRA